MRKPWIVGNWKMYTTRAEAVSLARAVDAIAAELGGRVDVGIAPPFVWITEVAAAVSTTRVFGQNAATEENGAFTAEVAPGMLRDAGAFGAIIGHSERRAIFGETDELIARRLERTVGAGLHAILCIGETLEEREAGRTAAVVLGQLETGLARVKSLEAITIAYEPVWAIGTGRTASPEQAQEVHAQIRAKVAELFGAESAQAVRIQYGGSVKPDNAATLLSMPDIDGALVGGASLKAESFGAILRAAAELA
jgi:triosephosphate isomerase